jgi:hypothetical protein
MMTRSLLVVAVASATVPAAAAIPISPLPDIYVSYNDCLAVAAPSGLSQSKLASLGWVQATMQTADPKAAAEPPLIYGKTDRKSLIILSSPRGKGLCIVMARIATRASFAEFLKAWGNALPASDKDGVISFKDEGHIVQIRQTGTDKEPALSMTVMTPLEKQ